MKRAYLIFRMVMLPIAVPFLFGIWLAQVVVIGVMEMSTTGDSLKEWISEYLYE